MYNTDRSNGDFSTNENIAYDCILLPLVENSNGDRMWGVLQIIPYCIRFKDNNNDIVANGVPFTFATLYQMNISVEILFSWSATVSILEQYALYLKYTSFVSLSQKRFYNCSSLWFGEHCQYSFDFDIRIPFSAIVEKTFINKGSAINVYNMSLITNYTCYEHLSCYRGPGIACLDWREICDGKIDCLDGGQDEENCSMLESNVCSEREYRCRNGQCIPYIFFRDNPVNADCMDKTDELWTSNFAAPCMISPAFRCEESTCPQAGEFSCGDGDCINNMLVGSSSSACGNGRAFHLARAMIISQRSNLSTSCLNALLHYTQTFGLVSRVSICANVTSCHTNPTVYIRENCPSLFTFPTDEPVLYGHVRFIFENTYITENNSIWLPEYICYDSTLCPYLPVTKTVLNLTCCRTHEMGLVKRYKKWDEFTLAVKTFFRICSTTKNQYQTNGRYYQCNNSSKYISVHRIIDGVEDCILGDDESLNDSCSFNSTHRLRCFSKPDKCISPILSFNNRKDCPNSKDESQMNRLIENIEFSMLCDNIDQSFIMPTKTINGRRETDETNCQFWSCNTPYTRCNKIWNCPNGIDEIHCLSPSPCPTDQHLCISPYDFNLTCLPLSRMNDTIVDCLGSTDEPYTCPPRPYDKWFGLPNFRCFNKNACVPTELVCHNYTTDSYCNGSMIDIEFCKSWNRLTGNNGAVQQMLPCHRDRVKNRTLFESVLCSAADQDLTLQYTSKFFLKDEIEIPIQHTFIESINQTPLPAITHTTQQIQFNIDANRIWYCNRGILIYRNATKQKRCLCPPSYYGERCQYQQQRISLTLQMQIPYDRNALFDFIVLLIDDTGYVHSYEKTKFLAARDCNSKFNIYLLYRSLPKDKSRNYSVHVEAFIVDSLAFKGAWLYPLVFPFLPVHRISIFTLIPFIYQTPLPTILCPIVCLNGHCQRFENHDAYFCRCLPGYFGQDCSMKHKCECADESLCIKLIANRSVCVCPLGKFGPRCILPHFLCQNNPCHNGGTCIPWDERIQNNYTCRCRAGFSGERCEFVDTQIMLSFEKLSHIPQFTILHFGTIDKSPYPIRQRIPKKIPFDQDSIVIYMSTPFHMIFVELDSQYYLVYLQKDISKPKNVTISVEPFQRCMVTKEFFNDTLLQYVPIRRIKYYQLPCRRQSHLTCFGDNEFMCLCDRYRYANCFNFQPYQEISICKNYKTCENGAQCFGDDSACPRTIVCNCAECYYGSRCQFSTKGYSLSLDGILGHHIRPNTALSQQLTIVKVCIVVAICMATFGLTNSILTFMTFNRKKVLENGCGIYILVLSMNSLMTTILFIIKFSVVIGTHMHAITARYPLQFSCILMDFLVRTCLAVEGWLNAAVIIERARTIVGGPEFDIKRSKTAAKYIVLIIYLAIPITIVHDPIHRQLSHDDSENHTWCLALYSPTVQRIDSTIHILHLLSPLCINVIMAITIIVRTARQRSAVQKRNTYNQHLREQLSHHKRLIISPMILAALAIPRAIISLVSGCLQSPRYPALFLFGYFISILPPLLSFFIYVPYSQFYRYEFKQSVIYYRKRIIRRCCLR